MVCLNRRLDDWCREQTEVQKPGEWFQRHGQRPSSLRGHSGTCSWVSGDIHVQIWCCFYIHVVSCRTMSRWACPARWTASSSGRSWRRKGTTWGSCWMLRSIWCLSRTSSPEFQETGFSPTGHPDTSPTGWAVLPRPNTSRGLSPPLCLFLIHRESSVFSHQQSRDQELDVDLSIAGVPQSMYSSLSNLGRSQYPTLPLGASNSNGIWAPQYPTLAHSPSAGSQSDSVFLDGGPDDPSLPPASPGRYCKDPTYPGGSQGELETDGPNGFHHPHQFHHSLPRRGHGINHNQTVPGERLTPPTSDHVCPLDQDDDYKRLITINDSVWSLNWISVLMCLPLSDQSTSTRRFWISDRGSQTVPARCLVKAPEQSDASPTAWTPVKAWKTRDTWSLRATGPQPLRPLTTRTIWTSWPKPTL